MFDENLYLEYFFFFGNFNISISNIEQLIIYYHQSLKEQSIIDLYKSILCHYIPLILFLNIYKF